MFVTTTTLRKGDKTYRYTRIQEAFRDGKGRSRNRTLATMRDLSEVAEGNLRAAVAAARDGRPVIVADDTSSHFATVAASLRYLDVAVALDLWNRWQLTTLLDGLLPRRDVQMAVSEVVAALTIHRCVAPGSKLSAERWYPRTALPEIQRFDPSLFNNSRVHRALEALDGVEEPLQEQLAGRVGNHRGRFAGLFLDVTDTWFEGHGPELAAKGRVKDGTYRRRIGIVLLCDDRGFPLRWKTLPGRYRENDAMRRVVEEIADIEWASGVPLVMDRAMGREQAVEFLASSGTNFITAVAADEFSSHTDDIPYEATTEVEVAGTAGARKDDLRRVREAAVRAGYRRVSERRYVLDLGVQAKCGGTNRRVVRRRRSETSSRVVEALRLAMSMHEGRQHGMTIPQLSKRHRCGTTTVKKHLRLMRLKESLRQRVLEGGADGLMQGVLEAIAMLPAEEQERAFDERCQTSPKQSLQRSSRWCEPEPPIELRYVVDFNPERFVDQRRVAMEQQRELDAFISDLNRKLRSPNSRRTEASVLGEVDRQLRKRKVVSAYTVEVSEHDLEGRTCLQAKLVRDEDAWRARQRYDGVNLIVAHPSIELGAAEIVEMYFAKDAVEKDFGTIKGAVELRPVRHRTDAKVSAHVSLCMLALLLERALECELREAGIPRTAPDVFETIADCRLNRLESGAATAYSVTRPTAEQRQLLGALKMERFLDDPTVREQIRPRQ